MDDELIKKGLELIKNSFGFEKNGMHKKKCEFCGYIFDEPNDLRLLEKQGPSKCPFCGNIDELDCFINSYEFKIMSDVEAKCGIKQNSSYNFYYRIEGQIKESKEHEAELSVLWKQITVDIDGNVCILESFFDGKYSFWDDGGNLKYYVCDSTLFFIVSRLSTLVKKSRTFLNIIINNKKALHAEKIYLVGEDASQNILFDENVPIIPIEEIALKIGKIFDDLQIIIDDFKAFRDKHIAHIDLNNKENFQKSISITNIRRVLSALKTIYVAYFLILAPHLYNPGFEMHGIDLDRMEYISKQWHDFRK
ncbi:MAG: hypothetical protein K6E21_04045 [Bacilli bacterium]|nr:hypothetical protein [Bacilli bacterium]